MYMARTDPWNPFRRNNPLTGGNPERNWLTRVHRDTPRSDQENTPPSAPDVLRRQVTGDSRLKQLARTAGDFIQSAFEVQLLKNIPLVDYILFHDWLYPNGKELNLDRALFLSQYYEQHYPQYQQKDIQYIEKGNTHSSESDLESLSLFGGDEDEDKLKKNINDNKYRKVLEAYEHDLQKGEQEGYHRDAYYRERDYRYKNELDNDPNNDPLG
jgi:hypothetical protein